MKKLILLALLCITASCYAQNYWQTGYNSKSTYVDEIQSMKIDTKGNIYITGSSGGNGTGFDCITLKYDPIGQIQWIERYDNEHIIFNNSDRANDLAVDLNGNVFITGVSCVGYFGGFNYDYDFLTIKYDSSGNLLWRVKYDSSTSSGSTSISLDNAGHLYVLGSPSFEVMGLIKYNINGSKLWSVRTSGKPLKVLTDIEKNIFVTGRDGTKLKIVKYSPDGILLWSDTLGYSNSYMPSAWDVTLDKQNNPVFIGMTLNSVDFLRTIVKYASNGTRLWVKNEVSSGGSDDRKFRAVITDTMNNIYVTGGNDSLVTIKLTPTGDVVWRKTYYNGFSEVGLSIAVDRFLNVFTTGRSNGDAITIKYNSLGVQQWVKIYNGTLNTYSESGLKVLVKDTTVYVGAYIYNQFSSLDYCLLKYTTSGSLSRVENYSGPFSNDDIVKSMVLDNSGNVFLAGYGASNTSNADFFTYKIDNVGNMNWHKRYEGSAKDTDIAYSLVKPDSKVYVTGTCKEITSGYDFLTIKYDSLGSQSWARKFNGLGNGTDIAKVVIADPPNNIYVTGKSYGAGTGFDIVTVKYDSSGNQIWSKSFNRNGTDDDEPSSMTFDSEGNIIITGKSKSPTSNADIITLKYDFSGNLLFSHFYNGASNGNDEGNSISADGFGNVYVCGKSQSTIGNQDLIVIKYNSSGVQQWFNLYNGASNAEDEGVSMNSNQQGDVFVGGYTKNSALNYDYVIIKYNSSGIQQWINFYNGAANKNDKAKSMVLGNSGNLYVTGTSENSTTGVGISTVKYNSQGQQVAVSSANFLNPETEAVSILLDINENVYITGNINNFNTTENHGMDILHFKLASNLSSVNYIGVNQPKNFSLTQNYPNPFNPQTKIKFAVPLNVKGQTSNVKLIIYDLLGREVATLVNEELKPGTYEADWDGSNFSSGVYFYKIISDDFVETKKMVLMK